MLEILRLIKSRYPQAYTLVLHSPLIFDVCFFNNFLNSLFISNRQLHVNSIVNSIVKKSLGKFFQTSEKEFFKAISRLSYLKEKPH